jgi:uncharacterized protein YxeA
MKKVILIIVALAVGVILTSFVRDYKYVENLDKGNDFVYYTRVEVWTEATESEINHIYYKEGNGVRKYYCTCDDTKSTTCLLYIRKNELYRSNKCNDFRRNYQYCTYWGTPHYFNCKLPYFTE